MRRGAGGNGRQLAALAAGLLAIGVLTGLGSVGTAATPRPKTASLRTQQKTLAQREHAAVLDLYALESRLAEARGTLAALRTRSASFARERELTRRRAAAIHRSLATARRRLAATLRALYMEAPPDPIAIFLGAGSIDEALDGIDGLRRAATANRKLIADLRRKQTRARAIDAELRARSRNLAAARRDAERGVNQLVAVARTKQRTLASLRTERDLTKRQVAVLDDLARKAQRRSVVLVAKTRPAAARTEVAATTSVSATLQTTGGQRQLVVDAVAYHLPGRTASGLPVGIGVVAVDPTLIPLGTRMFIPGYGRGVAADVGSAVKGRIIDLWMPSRAKALAWGRRTVTITIYG